MKKRRLPGGGWRFFVPLGKKGLRGGVLTNVNNTVFK